jgi:hypothetical protein
MEMEMFFSSFDEWQFDNLFFLFSLFFWIADTRCGLRMFGIFASHKEYELLRVEVKELKMLQEFFFLIFLYYKNF